MLKRMVTRALALALAMIAGCSDTPHPPPPPPQALSMEAGYELLYNDNLVGNALFTLDISGDGSYRLVAFTVPAGNLQQDVPHEVLETSEGHIAANAIHPASYAESVIQGEQVAVAGLQFDWQHHTLEASGPEGTRTLALLPDTHDRLSYLLAAQRLAASGAGSTMIQVATLEASEENRLEFHGREALSLPAGELDAALVRRITPDADDERRLWFADYAAPLPVRVVQQRDGNTVEMRLTSLDRSAPGVAPSAR